MSEIKAYYRRYGHEVYSIATDDSGQAYYVDNNEPFDEDHPRPCPQCHQLPTPESHDACLGTISGAAFACCGHGVEDGYVSWGHGQAYAEFSIFSVTVFGWTFELVRRRLAKEHEAASGFSYHL